MKSIVLFLVAFVVGAAVSLGVRAARHQPYAEPASSAVAAPPSDHAGHSAPEPSAGQSVNTVCSICGMDVDPEIPTANYQGKLVGFGCAACPPRFAKNPELYGPHALRNEIAPK